MSRLLPDYIAALYFTDTGEGDQPPVDAELAPETLERCREDCELFEYVASEYIPGGYVNGGHTWTAQAAHDFWLNRNGHGAGFWDGDWPEPAASQLDLLSKMFGEVWTYLGDDGLIYISGGRDL